MNVYDFDKTIFYPDSFRLFILDCCFHFPKLFFCYVPKTLVYALKLKTQKCTVTEAVEQLGSFVKHIPNIDFQVESFWKKNKSKIAKWYINQKKEDDLIISASPEFFLKPIIDELNVKLISSQIDKFTGKIAGRCCYGKEKVKYLISSDFFPENQIDNFYSDSLTDSPLAYCAEHAFLVIKKGKHVIPWPKINSKNIRNFVSKIKL